MSISDELHKSWQKWIRDISDDVEDLLFCKLIYDQFLNSLGPHRNNGCANVPRGDVVGHWMMNNYKVSTVMAIRRLSTGQTDKKSRSLARLLKVLADNASCLTRERFVQLWNNQELVDAGIADKQFAELIEDTHLICFSRELIESDCHKLKCAYDPLAPIADKKFGHKDKSWSADDAPFLTDLNRAITTIKELTDKYHLLLTAMTPAALPYNEEREEIREDFSRLWNAGQYDDCGEPN